jgi:hypothetical protein
VYAAALFASAMPAAAITTHNSKYFETLFIK